MTLIALILSVVIGFGALTWGFMDAGWFFLVRWVLLLGVFWLVSIWQNWKWFAPIGLILTILIAAFGLWFNLSLGWMIVGALGALLAWDLNDFRVRLKLISAREDNQGLERRHIARLTVYLVVTLVVISLAMVIQLRFTFEWVMLLALVAVLGFMQLVAWLRG